MAESDLDQVLAIENASFPSPWQREHFLHELQQNSFAHNWVLKRGATVVGYASVWHLERELKINNIAIAPELRGAGLGRRLLEAVVEEATREGCEKAELEVRPSNIAALKLYRRHGFRESGRRRNYYQREAEDAIVMEARLAPRV